MNNSKPLNEPRDGSESESKQSYIEASLDNLRNKIDDLEKFSIIICSGEKALNETAAQLSSPALSLSQFLSQLPATIDILTDRIEVVNKELHNALI